VAATAQSISVIPSSKTVYEGSLATFDLVLDSAPAGLAGYEVNVSLSSPELAEITSVRYPAWAGLNKNSSFPADNVMISGVDLEDRVLRGAADVPFATITIRGDMPGRTDVVVTVKKMDADDGGLIKATVISGRLNVIRADSTAPTTSIKLAGIPGNNGWYLSSVTVSLSATDPDDLPGAITTFYKIDTGTWTKYTWSFVVSGDAKHTIYYMSVDVAGNEEIVKQRAINIDRTAPKISLNVPSNGADYLLNSVVKADWSVADATSGMAFIWGTTRNGEPIKTGTAGSKLYSVIAEDDAGNWALKIISYKVVYKYGGVLPPLSDTQITSYKAGSSIQVGFKLYDANNVYAKNAEARLFVAQVINGRPGIEMPANYQVRLGTNLFYYDNTKNCYSLNLNTKSLPKGTWQLRIELDDGTSKYASVQLV
jgi:hypothetical protein